MNKNVSWVPIYISTYKKCKISWVPNATLLRFGFVGAMAPMLTHPLINSDASLFEYLNIERGSTFYVNHVGSNTFSFIK